MTHECLLVPRSWKSADCAAAMHDFLLHPPPRTAAIRDLMAELLSPNPYCCRCAAGLARRVSAREPGILSRHAGDLIDLAARVPDDEWQTRGYVLLAAAWNAQSHARRMRLLSLARTLLKDQRIGVRAIALEVFAILALAEPKLRREATLLLETAHLDPACAVRLRAKRILPQLLKVEINTRRELPNPPNRT